MQMNFKLTADQMNQARGAFYCSLPLFEIVTIMAVRILPLVCFIASLYMVVTGVNADWTLVAAVVGSIALAQYVKWDLEKRFHQTLIGWLIQMELERMMSTQTKTDGENK